MGKIFKFPSKRKKEKWVLSTANYLGENIFNDFHIEMNSNKEITVEGKICVYEYKSDYVKLHLKNGYLTVTGADFDILNYETDSITFKGIIKSVDLEI